MLEGKLTTAMTLRIDAAIKKEASKYLEQLGLSTSEAVRLFLYSVVRHKGLPFEIKVPNKETEQVLRQIEAGEKIEALSFEDIISELGNVRRRKT
jgi:DNA-damage-inducible protein J